MQNLRWWNLEEEVQRFRRAAQTELGVPRGNINPPAILRHVFSRTRYFPDRDIFIRLASIGGAIFAPEILIQQRGKVPVLRREEQSLFFRAVVYRARQA